MKLSQFRVLHVDDNPRDRRFFKEVGDNFDWHVTGVSDGLLGLLLSTSQQFDIIVTDVKMPRLNGLDMVEMLRVPGNFNVATPVIFISRRVDDDLKARAKRLGVDSVLSKPFLPSALSAEAQRLIGSGEACDEALKNLA